MLGLSLHSVRSKWASQDLLDEQIVKNWLIGFWKRNYLTTIWEARLPRTRRSKPRSKRPPKRNERKNHRWNHTDELWGYSDLEQNLPKKNWLNFTVKLGKFNEIVGCWVECRFYQIDHAQARCHHPPLNRSQKQPYRQIRYQKSEPTNSFRERKERS